MAFASTDSRQAPEVDIELFTFVERYATNLIRWDLLLFFGGHPDVRITAADIARKLRRTVRATTKELDDLTYLRVLTRRYKPELVTYQLVNKGSARRTLMRLAAYGRGKGPPKKE